MLGYLIVEVKISTWNWDELVTCLAVLKVKEYNGQYLRYSMYLRMAVHIVREMEYEEA